MDIPRRRGRPRKDEERPTRELLLDAALRLFASKGYAATTVREIAAAVGVRDSALYTHFAGKEAIYHALLGAMGPTSLAALQIDSRAVAQAGPRRALPNLAARLVEMWSAPRARLFASVVLREGKGGDGVGGLAAAIAVARARLEEPFRRWQDAGVLRADVAAGQLVWEFFAPLHVLRFLHLRAHASDADLVTARRVADDHVRFFLTCTAPARRRAG